MKRTKTASASALALVLAVALPSTTTEASELSNGEDGDIASEQEGVISVPVSAELEQVEYIEIQGEILNDTCYLDFELTVDPDSIPPGYVGEVQKIELNTIDCEAVFASGIVPLDLQDGELPDDHYPDGYVTERGESIPSEELDRPTGSADPASVQSGGGPRAAAEPQALRTKAWAQAYFKDPPGIFVNDVTSVLEWGHDNSGTVRYDGYPIYGKYETSGWYTVDTASWHGGNYYAQSQSASAIFGNRTFTTFPCLTPVPVFSYYDDLRIIGNPLGQYTISINQHFSTGSWHCVSLLGGGYRHNYFFRNQPK